MKLQLKKGVTSKLIDVFVQDTTKTDGSGLTGLLFGASGLSAYYYREGAASAVSISLQTMTLGTWATGGFIVVDGTNMPGCYQLGLPDAALATGANSVIVILRGAANMAPVLLEIQLTDTDVNDVVRFGLTALPNAVAGATGGLDCATLQGGTAQAGSAATTLVLAAGASATDNLYANLTVAIAGGTGIGQSRNIVSYVGSTKTATVDQAWITTPDNTSVYQVTGRRTAPSPAMAMGTASAGGANTITLQTALGADNVISGASITIVSGTGQGETRGILGYVNSTKVVTVDRPYPVQPDSTSVYVVFGSQVQPILTLNTGTAQAGAASSITLSAAASATNDLYDECSVQIVGGTGVGQIRDIIGYVGSTKVATIDRAWATNPDNTSIYVVSLANLVATNGVGGLTTTTLNALSANLLATALAELAQAQPSATPTLAQAITLLYMAFRNARTLTATTDSITNNAGTVIAKATTSDDGTTFTRTTMVSGP